jgi:septation ring formation regulator EzrA
VAHRPVDVAHHKPHLPQRTEQSAHQHPSLTEPFASAHYEPNLCAVSEERGDLILEHLRAIRSEIGDLKTSMVEVNERLGFFEAQYASISRRVDRIDSRLERIERRLDLVEA